MEDDDPGEHDNHMENWGIRIMGPGVLRLDWVIYKLIIIIENRVMYLDNRHYFIWLSSFLW